MCNLEIIKHGISRAIHHDKTIDRDLVATKGRVVDYILSSLHDVVCFLGKIIEQAEREILFVMSYWEGKSLSAAIVNRSIRKAIAKRPEIKIRIIVDNGTWENVLENVRTIPPEKWRKVLGLRAPKGSDIAVKSAHVPLLGTMHAKFLVVDGKTMVLCSNNIQDRPNAELAVSMEGPVCISFQDVFARLWFYGQTTQKQDEISETEQNLKDPLGNDGGNSVPPYDEMLVVNRRMYGGLSRDVYSPQNCAFWTMMATAKRNIVICTPTFNAFHAKMAVFKACCRGVHVTLILTKNFNDKKETLPLQGGTNLHVMKRLLRKLKARKDGSDKNLELRWYVGQYEILPKVGVHSHVKFLSVDEEIICFGNANMDTQSWSHSMECNVILCNRDLVFQLNSKTAERSIRDKILSK